MSESLKPCPLPKCGGDAVVWKHGSVVSCSKCHFTSLLEHWQELPRTDQTAQKIAEELEDKARVWEGHGECGHGGVLRRFASNLRQCSGPGIHHAICSQCGDETEHVVCGECAESDHMPSRVWLVIWTDENKKLIYDAFVDQEEAIFVADACNGKYLPLPIHEVSEEKSRQDEWMSMGESLLESHIRSRNALLKMRQDHDNLQKFVKSVAAELGCNNNECDHRQCVLEGIRQLKREKEREAETRVKTAAEKATVRCDACTEYVAKLARSLGYNREWGTDQDCQVYIDNSIEQLRREGNEACAHARQLQKRLDRALEESVVLRRERDEAYQRDLSAGQRDRPEWKEWKGVFRGWEANWNGLTLKVAMRVEDPLSATQSLYKWWIEGEPGRFSGVALGDRIAKDRVEACAREFRKERAEEIIKVLECNQPSTEQDNLPVASNRDDPVTRSEWLRRAREHLGYTDRKRAEWHATQCLIRALEAPV